MKTILHLASAVALFSSTHYAAGLPTQFEGPPDLVSVRDSFSLTENILTIRVKFHVVQTDRFPVGNPQSVIARDAAIDLLVNELNSIYQFAGIAFLKSATDYVTPGADLLAVDSSDEKRRLMDLAIDRNEATTFLNIVVAPIRNLGFDGHATFPWSRRALRAGSGILLSDEFVFPFNGGELDPQIAAHEIGHALGLWHVERGVNNRETDGLQDREALLQSPLLSSNTDLSADSKGDFCRDTPPIPYADELGLRYTIDLVVDPVLNTETLTATYTINPTPNITWSALDIANLMRSSGDRRFISSQQKGRMRGWISHRLRSWLAYETGPAVEAVIGDPEFTQIEFKPGTSLEWVGPVGATFEIKRSVDPGFPTTAPTSTTPANPISITTPQSAVAGSAFIHPSRGGNWQRYKITDFTVENGKPYWYRVQIANTPATASYSPRMDVRGAGARTSNARPGLIPVPSDTRSVPGGVLIEWQDSADEEISGFEVRRSFGGTDELVKDVAPGSSRFASVFDTASKVDKSTYAYRVLSYYETEETRIHSGNIGDGPEQGKDVIFSATPPPGGPVLSYTKANTAQGWRGTIKAAFRGGVPAPTTTGGSIWAVLESQENAQVVWQPAGTSAVLTTGASSPLLFTVGNLPTGANYHYRLNLVENLRDAGNTDIGNVEHGFSKSITLRIPGKITTAPVAGLPAISSTGVTSYPTFTWTKVQDAEFYDIIISGPHYPNTTIRIAAGSGSQLSYALNGATYSELDALASYTWRVRAGNVETPNGGPLSQTRSFTTYLRPVNLISPAAAAQLIVPYGDPAVRPTFTWDGMPGTHQYRLRVYDNSGTNVYNSGLINQNSNAVNTDVLNAGNYTWSVLSVYNAGEQTAVSETRAFNVRSAPVNPPAQYGPVDGITGARQRPIFEWQKLNLATDYVIEIVQQTDTGNRWWFGGTTAVNLLGVGVPLVGTEVAGNTSRLEFEFPASVAELPGARKFFWRIRGRNEIGNGPWSAEAEPDSVAGWATDWDVFITRLDAPVLTSPANGGTTGDSSPNLVWTSGAGTSSNEVEVFSGTTITGTPVATQTVSGDSWNMPVATNELSDGTYTWRVRSLGPPAGNPQIISAWSQATFTVATPPRNSPNPLNPLTYNLNRTITPNFQWDPLNKATSYRIEIRLGTGTTIFNQGGITGSGSPLTYTLPGANALAYGTDYTWRIRGASALGEGPPSAWNTFRTELPATTPLSPISGAYVSDRTPILRATTVTGATRYEFRIIKGNPSNGVYGSGLSVSGSNAWTATPELSNGTYYWRVRAIGPPSDGTNGPWSGDFMLEVRGEPTTAPTMIAPAHNATNQLIRPEFRWSSLNLATSYDLQIVHTGSGPTVLYNSVTTSFTIPDALDRNQSYYWRVRGRNEFGIGPWSAATGIWSSYFKFWTRAAAP